MYNALRSFGLPALVLVVMAASWPAEAHSPGVVLSGVGVAAIDGVLSPGEWDGAGCVDFPVNIPEGGTTPGTVCAMNSNRDLYLAVRFARVVTDSGNSASFEFDNDHSGGEPVSGDDVILINPSIGFRDEVLTMQPPCPSGAICGSFDTTLEGTNDGAGVFHNDGMFTVYEFSHPLDSADDAHDFRLSSGSTVGFTLSIRIISAAGTPADTAFPALCMSCTSLYGDIVIAEAGNDVLEPPPPAGPAEAFVTRLYENVLGRQPGLDELAGWVRQIQEDGSVVPTVLAFFHSPEFLSRNTSHEQFLTILYRTFLNRDPDPDGFTAFLTSLQTVQVTRDNLLDIFMDSQEFQAQASFLPPQDPVTTFVTTLYVRILGRGPDPAGLQSFVTQLRQACSALPTVQFFLASPEYQARQTTNTAFVTLLYRVFLNRVPDAGGLTAFVTPLTQGSVTRDQLVAQFAASAEFQAIQHELIPNPPFFACLPVGSLLVSASGPGAVTSSPGGIGCNPTCLATFAPGTTVTLTAHNAPTCDRCHSFANFLGWGGDCAFAGTNKTCTLVMTTSKTVSARFRCPLLSFCGLF